MGCTSGKQDLGLALPGEEEDGVEYGDHGETAWDDVNGTQLGPQEVKKARREEIKYYKEM